jgi:hypothetical protein
MVFAETISGLDPASPMQYTLANLIHALEALPNEERQGYIREFLDALTGDAKWERLLDSPESQRALEDLAQNAQRNRENGKSDSLRQFIDRYRDRLA